jgi:hypothetical protein
LRKQTTLVAASFLWALTGTAAFACGVCIEDRIATVYDHAVVTRALAQKHHVGFFGIDGLPTGDEGPLSEVRWIADSINGVDKGSSRISVETGSLSLAFDPQRVSIVELRKILHRKLAAMKLSVLPLRVIDGRR